MHEATIAHSILEIVTDKYKATPHSRGALKVNIIVGEFRNVDLESLQFAFDNLRPLYSGCAACQLKAELVEAKALCLNHGHRFSPRYNTGFQCPDCGGPIGKLICGEELDVIGITLEAESDKQ
ncbi:MAG: hydrogenase maturation nickel metallochaperone HypA [Candidatus Obscuribacterales bacterium]|nr:hydrogenase maturation nickel metallochaperone HypA [Candidatus Obscuribacterales bacterium]